MSGIDEFLNIHSAFYDLVVNNRTKTKKKCLKCRSVIVIVNKSSRLCAVCNHTNGRQAKNRQL